MTRGAYKNYSVVIPTAKAEQHVRASIMSMVNQTLPPSEILIVLNNYDSATLTEVLDISREYPIVKIHEADVQSCSCATNFGIEKVKNDVIMRMDADDIAAPKRAEMQLKLLNDGADIVGSSITSFGASRKNWRVHKSDKYLKTLALFESPLPGPTLTFLNDSKLRYTAGFNHGDDRSFLLNAIQNGFKLAGIKKSLVHYRVHNTSMTNRKLTSDQIKSNDQIINKMKKSHWDTIFGETEVELIYQAIQRQDLQATIALINKYDVHPKYIIHRLITSGMIKAGPAFAAKTKLQSFALNK